MSRAQTTLQDFTTVYEAMRLRGERISIRKLRAELGGGSLSTISAMLKQVEAARAADLAAPPAPELDALEQFAPGAYQRIREAFRSQVQAELAFAREHGAAADMRADELQAALAESERRELERLDRIQALEERLASQQRMEDLLKQLVDEGAHERDAALSERAEAAGRLSGLVDAIGHFTRVQELQAGSIRESLAVLKSFDLKSEKRHQDLMHQAFTLRDSIDEQTSRVETSLRATGEAIFTQIHHSRTQLGALLKGALRLLRKTPWRN